MKNDKYLRIILTIIAICLVWICLRDIKIGSNLLYANSSMEEPTNVTISEIDWEAREKIKKAVFDAMQESTYFYVESTPIYKVIYEALQDVQPIKVELNRERSQSE